VLVGHFGTFGALIADLLAPAAARVLRDHPAVRLLLIGRGSERFREQFIAAHPNLNDRVIATGELPPDAIPAYLRACDLLLQPFPDGVSSRRTSVMAGLANGVPVVTNLGDLSEPFWAQNGCVALGLDALPRLLADPAARADLGRRGQDAYRSHFSVKRLVSGLSGPRP
jgi:glycosyltransferase involved in cell wall biosynthesis